VGFTTEHVRGVAPDHVVQFYGDDGELARAVGRYLAEAIHSGGVAIVIATGAHREHFAAALSEAGADVARASADGTLRMLDAAEAMAFLVVDGRIAPDRFETLIGDLVREATGTGRPVRAFGEIVALLWADGLVTAALELEALWNRLGQEVEFSLYCGYPASVRETGDAEAVKEICRQHSSVVSAVVEPPPARTALRRTRTFLGDRRAPAEVRRFVAAALGARRPPQLVGNAVLVASELATNAVRHGGGDLTVTISGRPGGAVRISVHDAGAALPELRQAEPLDSSGRGLALVSALATRWGVERRVDGKEVWAEVAAADG
jgi:anti-sigma regulatory factor (Ser/Thr protein kinase)